MSNNLHHAKANLGISLVSTLHSFDVWPRGLEMLSFNDVGAKTHLYHLLTLIYCLDVNLNNMLNFSKLQSFRTHSQSMLINVLRGNQWELRWIYEATQILIYSRKPPEYMASHPLWILNISISITCLWTSNNGHGKKPKITATYPNREQAQQYNFNPILSCAGGAGSPALLPLAQRLKYLFSLSIPTLILGR